MTPRKVIPWTRQTFVTRGMSLLFNMMSKLVIVFLPRNKSILISCLQSPSAVILESKKMKSLTVSTVSPSVCHEAMGPDAVIFIFWMLSFKPASSLSSFTFIKRLFNHLTLVRMAAIQKSITINAGEGVEKREPSYTVGGNANWYSHYREQCGDSLKN